ncbi:MAG TPA: nuclear transport factor 2 family protein, partial [Gammaproteobacteria bacterium]|nr:nuclear transport factor 2 family protein [Gammaproteobacteria bacterium]
IFVPYAGGWAKNKDANGAKYVSDKLPPDRPPSVVYKTWPNTFLPPFDFENPVSGRAARARAAAFLRRAKDPAAAGDARTPAGLTDADGGPAEIDGGRDAAIAAKSTPALQVLATSAALLAREVGLLEDQRDIENLERIYGYYLDKGLWTQAADLFAEDGSFEVCGKGVYAGKAHVLAYLRSIDKEGSRYGRLFDRMQLQAIVDVAPDGETAKGRWHLFAQEADWGKFADWGLGVYENDYVKQGGSWKIAHLRLCPTMYTPYAEGWGKKALPRSSYASKLPPDEPPTIASRPFPAEFVVPFHYPNPVTGGPAHEKDRPAAADASGLERRLAALERRIGLLEDADAVERLHAIYGYYLARNQWDDLAGIFAEDGAIEIAMRGIYVGRTSVRRNLNLYGKQGVQFGFLHNHMQLQPVIDVAPDGKTAKMRSRALSIMGNYHQAGMWMGGVYENQFVKINGVWQIKLDHVFNTYFTTYDVGWKNLPQRDPPGITASNPPDLPPSMPFEMYPKQFVPPFHYDNPVTGKR